MDLECVGALDLAHMRILVRFRICFFFFFLALFVTCCHFGDFASIRVEHKPEKQKQ